MRLIHYLLSGVLLLAGPTLALAAGGGIGVRAIGFTGSNDPGPTDARLAPYEATLRSNLPSQSFRYNGESSTTVAPGGAAPLSLPGGGRAEVQADQNGTVRVSRGGTAVTVSRGRPAVFLNGPPGRGTVSGVIVLAQ